MRRDGWLAPGQDKAAKWVCRRPGNLLRIVMLVAAATVAGCSPWADLPPVPKTTSTDYRLGPGDRVRIITFGEQELTGEFRVNDSGNIALPLVGNVRAAGLTPAELETQTTERLRSSRLFRNPSVSAEVVAYRPIFVLGEVNKPGQFSDQPGMTVLTAVAVAGGFTYRAVDNKFSIVRTIDGRAAEYRANRQTLLQPGDVVTVYERYF